MRKRYKKKKHSCKICKPHKMGLEKRWNPKEEAALERFERDKLMAKQIINGTKLEYVPDK